MNSSRKGLKDSLFYNKILQVIGGVFFLWERERERERMEWFFFFFFLTKEALESELDGTYRGNKMTNSPLLMLEIDRFLPRIFLLISLPFVNSF